MAVQVQHVFNCMWQRVLRFPEGLTRATRPSVAGLMLAAVSVVCAADDRESSEAVAAAAEALELEYLQAASEASLFSLATPSHADELNEAPSIPGEWKGFAGVSWGCNGPILAMAEGVDGRIYMGGEFSVCADVPADNIVAYDPVDNEFIPLGAGSENGVDGAVHAIEAVDERVYVGGDFGFAGGIATTSIAVWSDDGWQALADDVEVGSVRALHWFDDALYVGGFFTGVTGGGVSWSSDYFAIWKDGEWAPFGDRFDRPVLAITSWNGLVFVGGTFTEVDGLPASCVVAWDGTAFLPLAGAAGEGVSSVGSPKVSSLAADDTALYVGGSFNQAGGNSIRNVARWDGSEWFPIGSSSVNGVNGGVDSVSIRDGQLVLGGWFSEAGNRIRTRRVATWDGEFWGSLGWGFENGVTDGSVRSVLHTDGGIFVGGRLYRSGTVVTNNVARYDELDGWRAVGGSGYLGLSGAVHTVLADDDYVYVGGGFGTAGDVAAKSLAKWDGTQWHAMFPEGVSGVVNALAFDEDGSLIVGGHFSIDLGRGDSIKSIARWDGSQFLPITESFFGFNSSVNAISVNGGGFCVGGDFTDLFGPDLWFPVNRVACWDGSVWNALDVGLDGPSDTRVDAITHYLGDVYVGGRFTEAGGQPANRVARWDGQGWHALGAPPDDGVDYFTVEALTVFRSALYVGGWSWLYGGETLGSLGGIARWIWKDWDVSPDPVNDRVISMDSSSLGVYVAGDFTEVYSSIDDKWKNLARIGLWDGSRWRALGLNAGMQSGLPDTGNVVMATDEGVWVGGSFSRAGDQATAGLAFFRIQQSIFRDGFEAH